MATFIIFTLSSYQYIMIKGLDKFKVHFQEHSDKYILIGGAACDYWFSDYGSEFRATKDLDIILVVEALDNSFFSSFWDFIKKGNYGKMQCEEKKKQYYRFNEPAEEGYPYQIELFSRKSDIIKLPEEAHLTPIPADEEFSSLPAIILDDVFYNFVKDNCMKKDDFPLLNIPGLICLKAKAFFELKERKKKENIREKEIKKHRNDIIRLLSLLTKNERIILPYKIKEVM